MLMRRILFFLWLLFTLTERAEHAHGQSRPRPEKGKFESPLSVRFQLKWAPDSSRLHQVLFACPSQSGRDTLYWAVTQMGALILYQDNKGKVPCRLEKQKYFPFQRLMPGPVFTLEVSACSGKDAWLGARIRNPSGNLVDEVFFCYPRQEACFSALLPFMMPWMEEK
jgi:hypothetical protein